VLVAPGNRNGRVEARLQMPVRRLAHQLGVPEEHIQALREDPPHFIILNHPALWPNGAKR
jgi:hypothetical protein